MTGRGGGGGVPGWLLVVLLAGAGVFAYVERDPILLLLKGAGVVVGSSEGAGAAP